VRVCAILYEPQPAAAGDLQQRVHVGHSVAKMDYDDRPRARRDRQLYEAMIEAEREWIDVDEGDPQPEEVRGRGRSAEREGRHEHLVTGHEPQRLVGSQQRRGAARGGYHVRHSVQ
jgi:hypothetical protein